MRLNLNFQVRDLDGKPFTDEASNAGKIFASALAQHTQGPIAKTARWIKSQIIEQFQIESQATNEILDIVVT